MKTVLVTGGTRGLGLAIVDDLANNGYHVIATGRSSSSELDDIMNRSDQRVHFEKLDLSGDNLHIFIRLITKKYGHLYGLVNNAAIGLGGVLATMHETDIDQLLQVNIKAPILLAKYASRSMLIKGEGRIINISSIIASTGFNGLSVYGATKASMIGFTKSLSRELGKANITVNSVAPGFMETHMTAALGGEKLDSIRRRTPSRKLPTTKNVSSGVLFLLDTGSSMITGTTITIDGGSTA